MPHISIKHFPNDFSSQTKARVAEQITQLISEELRCSPDVVSISMEEVAESQWQQAVYQPEIIDKKSLLLKHPNY